MTGINTALLSKGYKKIFNYLFEIEKTARFQKRIKELRRKHLIPELGYKYVRIPDENNQSFIHPTDWSKEIVDYHGGEKELDRHWEEIEQELETIESDYGLYSECLARPFENYLFFNIFFDPEEPYPVNDYDLCLIKDLPQENEKDEDESMNQYWERKNKKEEKFYPVCIQISPYASLGDILEYIKRFQFHIKRIQNKYRNKAIKIGSVKRKNKMIQERNDFIYENRDLPRKELMKLGMAKFKDFPDHGAVAKIISLERKRREEV